MFFLRDKVRHRVHRGKTVTRRILAATFLASTSLFGLVATHYCAARADEGAVHLDADFSKDTGPFYGGGSGTLYGLYDSQLPRPNTVEGIHLRTVATKAQDGIQHPGADALEVNKLLTEASGGDTVIYMTDVYRDFPYNWKTGDCAASLNAYMDKLRLQAEQVQQLPREYRKHIILAPFNEPEGNMFSGGDSGCDGVAWLDNPTTFFNAWDRAYRLLRATAPGVRILGPNTSILFYPQDFGFFQHAVAAGTVPDVVSWHELNNAGSLRANVKLFRQWVSQLSLGRKGRPFPIDITEYAYNYHTSVPGQMVQWLSAIEDSKIDADIAYWNVDGDISDSVVHGTGGNGQWWLLNAYASMAGGRTVEVTPPSPGEAYTLQGVAALKGTDQARLLFGGGTGPATIGLKHLPRSFGSRVRVLVREIRWTGQIGDSAPPTVVSDSLVPLQSGGVRLAFDGSGLPLLRDESAYEVIVTPAPASGATPPKRILWSQDYEAESASLTGSGLSIVGPEGSPSRPDLYYTSNGHAVAGFNTSNNAGLSFAVNVPQTGDYDLRIMSSTFNVDPLVTANGPTNIFITVDRNKSSEKQLWLPLAYRDVVWDHADTKIKLTGGSHVITLSTRGMTGQHTTGDAMIDRVTLSLRNPAAPDTIYEAQFATLRNTAAIHADQGEAVPMTTDAEATFWVYAPSDGVATLAFDGIGDGQLGLRVNDQDLPLPANRTTTAFLLGGVNKVSVTGIGGALRLERLRVSDVTPSASRHHIAAAAKTAGTARVMSASLASTGRAVFNIGGDPGNGNTLTFPNVAVTQDGTYALTLRYSNDEQPDATHYNPDTMARIARISINGGAAIPFSFPNTFHRNNWWETSVFVKLRAGSNTIRISGQEQPNWDGKTYASQVWPNLLLRSRYAPNVDWLMVTALDGTKQP